MNALQLVRQFCQRSGVPAPTTITSSVDPTVIQMVALLNEVGEEMVDRWNWPQLTRAVTFTSVLGENQGDIDTLATDGFNRILNGTMFNRTNKLEIYGQLSPSTWEQAKAIPVTGTLYRYRFIGQNLMFNPPSQGGETIAFEYISNNHIVRAVPPTSDRFFLYDADESVLPDTVILAGLRYKWKSEKGLDYSEDFRRFEEMANNAAGRSMQLGPRSLVPGNDSMGPCIVVSPGSWPL